MAQFQTVRREMPTWSALPMSESILDLPFANQAQISETNVCTYLSY